MRDNGPILKNKGMLLLFAVILVAAISLVCWTIIKTNRQMRADMVRQAYLIARAANVNRIKALTGTEADLVNSSYLRLKEQLAIAKQTNSKCRFIYLVSRRSDGTIIFLADTENPDSKDYSPPGQVYDEAPENFRHVFATHDASTVGPYTDRWGKWVTAIVPVHDPQTITSGFATPGNAQSMVREALDFLRKNGRDSFLEEVNSPNGRFQKNDLYVFVYDRDMTLLAHPTKTELVGQNQLDMKDWTGGKYFHREIQQVAPCERPWLG